MEATPLTDRERQQLDQLVPPPWSAARRAVVSVIVLLLVAGAVWVARSGWVGPVLGRESGVGGGGTYDERTGEATAFRQVELINHGRLQVEVLDIELPELPGVTWTGTDPPLPLTIGPGARLVLDVWMQARRCADVDAGGLGHLPLRAKSGLAPARVVRIRAPSVAEPTWRGAIAQPASWVTESLDVVCTIPDDGDERGDG